MFKSKRDGETERERERERERKRGAEEVCISIMYSNFPYDF